MRTGTVKAVVRLMSFAKITCWLDLGLKLGFRYQKLLYPKTFFIVFCSFRYLVPL